MEGFHQEGRDPLEAMSLRPAGEEDLVEEDYRLVIQEYLAREEGNPLVEQGMLEQTS